MSDYQVSLVNNKMSEFFVKFYGPAESESQSHASGCLCPEPHLSNAGFIGCTPTTLPCNLSRRDRG